MSIRVKLYAAMAVAVLGLGLTAGVGIWGLTHLSDRFDSVQRAGDARALALQLKFDVTDFNGWQTAYGYDNGQSRPIFLASVSRFRAALTRSRRVLQRPEERAVIDRIATAADEFMRVDARAWAALQTHHANEVRRLFLGAEIANFQRAAAAAQALASFEESQARHEDARFHTAHHDALRLLVVAAIVASLLVALLLVTAVDLARTAENALSARPAEGLDEG